MEKEEQEFLIIALIILLILGAFIFRKKTPVETPVETPQQENIILPTY